MSIDGSACKARYPIPARAADHIGGRPTYGQAYFAAARYAQGSSWTTAYRSFTPQLVCNQQSLLLQALLAALDQQAERNLKCGHQTQMWHC